MQVGFFHYDLTEGTDLKTNNKSPKENDNEYITRTGNKLCFVLKRNYNKPKKCKIFRFVCMAGETPGLFH